jgi:hypothetical protein
VRRSRTIAICSRFSAPREACSPHSASTSRSPGTARLALTSSSASNAACRCPPDRQPALAVAQLDRTKDRVAHHSSFIER